MGVLDAIDRAVSADPTSLRRHVDVILGADLDAEWRRIQASLDEAARLDERDGSIGDPFPNTTKAVERMEELREQIEAATLRFEFEPIDWMQRLALQAEHPPRADHLLDLSKGVNNDTFMPAVIRAAFVKVTDPSGDVQTKLSEARWTALLGPVKNGKPVLTLNQVLDLFRAADAGMEPLRVPMSARFLLGSQDSGASSTPSGPGKARPRSGSTAGSRRGSLRSSTTAKKTASSSRGSRSGS